MACYSLNICINGVYAVLAYKSHIFKPIQLPLQNITHSFSVSYIIQSMYVYLYVLLLVSKYLHLELVFSHIIYGIYDLAIYISILTILNLKSYTQN